MDIVTAVSTLGQAINIIKSLRDIDKGMDSAAYKAQMAELYNDLSDIKMALTDARETIHTKDQKIKELEAKIDYLTSGENCPICREGRLKITASKAHPVFQHFGVQQRTFTCQNSKCNHVENRYFDPSKQR
jgi:hypothetical protein